MKCLSLRPLLLVSAVIILITAQSYYSTDAVALTHNNNVNKIINRVKRDAAADDGNSSGSSSSQSGTSIRLVNIAGGARVSASTVETTGSCISDRCAPWHVTDVDIDPEGETEWSSRRQETCMPNETITVDWSNAQKGSIPIYAVNLNYGGNPAKRQDLVLFAKKGNTDPIPVTVEPKIDADGALVYYLDPPVDAAKLTFTFYELQFKGGLCYLEVDEIKALTAVTGSAIIAAIPAWGIALIVITVLFLTAGGVLLFLRQRELAVRMGVRVPMTDGTELKAMSNH